MSGKGGKPRKNVGVKGLSPHLKEMRRRDAAERQKAYDKLSIKEKIARLDAKFGEGKGAKKVRAKLAKNVEPVKVDDRLREFVALGEKFVKSKKK